MSYQKAFNQYPVLSATKTLPASWSSSDEPSPIPSRCFAVQTVSNNKQTVGESDQCSFGMATHSFSLVESGVLALRGKLNVTCGTGGAGAFELKAGVATTFERLEITLNGGNSETVPHYWLESQKRYIYALSNENRKIGNLLELAGAVTFTANTTTSHEFCLPLKLSSIFYNDRDFPLYLCSSVTITLYTRSCADIFNANVTSFTITEPTLVYNRIEIDPQVCNQIRQNVMGGTPYIMNMVAYDNVSQNATGNPYVQYNKSLKSLLGVQLTSFNTTVLNGTKLDNLSVKVDGLQITSGLYKNDKEVLYNTLKFYNKIDDKNVAILDDVTAANFLTDYYLLSIDTVNVNELGYSQKGISCSQIEVSPTYSASPNGIMYISFYYDARLIFNPDGTIIVNYSM